MITLGTILLIGGIMTGILAVMIVGFILIVAGLVLGVLGAAGHPVGGREHWY